METNKLQQVLIWKMWTAKRCRILTLTMVMLHPPTASGGFHTDTRFTEDHTNLHLHAKANAQEAIALARQRAHAFDYQSALERKTNEAMKLAKGQAHIRDDADDLGEPSDKPPLVDCMAFLFQRKQCD